MVERRIWAARRGFSQVWHPCLLLPPSHSLCLKKPNTSNQILATFQSHSYHFYKDISKNSPPFYCKAGMKYVLGSLLTNFNMAWYIYVYSRFTEIERGKKRKRRIKEKHIKGWHFIWMGQPDRQSISSFSRSCSPGWISKQTRPPDPFDRWGGRSPTSTGASSRAWRKAVSNVWSHPALQRAEVILYHEQPYIN